YEYPSERNGLIYKLNSKIIYKNGEMIHKKYYGKNGQLTQTYDKTDSNYVDADWYNDNQKRNEETYMSGGIEVDKRWWSNGHLILKQTIKDSLLVNLECNDTNGTSINIGTFKNGNGILLNNDEIWLDFSDLGYYNFKKVNESSTYKNGRQNGLSITYFKYPNDTSGISYYKNDTLNGRYIEYYPNHKKKATGFYKKGIENGVKREYNESGVLVKEITYVNGDEVKQKNIMQHKVVVDDKKRIAVINSFLNSLKTNYNPDSVRFKYYDPKILALLYSKYLPYSKADIYDSHIHDLTSSNNSDTNQHDSIITNTDSAGLYYQQLYDLKLENHYTGQLSEIIKIDKYVILNYNIAKMKYPNLESCDASSFSSDNPAYYSTKDIYVIVLFENPRTYSFILMRGDKIQDLGILSQHTPNLIGFIIEPGDYGYTYKDPFWDEDFKIPLILKKKDIPK
ncbi:MAG TPA: hypothetical protein VNG53_11995, partial [Bacteroidia bacterium]|nr:hypothetical protein [Bacteroidia bacterium]